MVDTIDVSNPALGRVPRTDTHLPASTVAATDPADYMELTTPAAS